MGTFSSSSFEIMGAEIIIKWTVLASWIEFSSGVGASDVEWNESFVHKWKSKVTNKNGEPTEWEEGDFIN